MNPYIGYENAAKVVKQALAEGRTFVRSYWRTGCMSEEEVDRALDVEAMTRGGIVK